MRDLRPPGSAARHRSRHDYRGGPVYLTDPHPQLTPLSITPVTQWAGDFDVVLRPQGTKTVVAGPTRITLKDGGLHGIILTDNPNGTTIDMTFIDDFQ